MTYPFPAFGSTLKLLYDPITDVTGIFIPKTGRSTLTWCFDHCERVEVPRGTIVMSCRHPVDRFNSRWSAQAPVNRYKSVEDFAFDILEGSDDPHILPQSRFGRYDHLIRYETFEKDFRWAKKLFSESKDLVHYNASHQKIDAYGLLPEYLRRELEEYYRKDYEQFEYIPTL